MANTTQSYTIYIRYPSEKTNNKCIPNNENVVNNTKPMNTPSGGSSGGSGEDSSGVSPSGIVRMIKNPMSALIGGASKAMPAVAGALAAAKFVDYVVETALPFYEGYTGDYRVSFNYANAKAVIGALTNPIGAMTSVAQRQMEIYRENLKVQQQRMLTGNSIINTYGGRTSN